MYNQLSHVSRLKTQFHNFLNVALERVKAVELTNYFFSFYQRFDIISQGRIG